MFKRVVILCILTAFVMADTKTIKRKRATLREGPGSYYPAIAELKEGHKVTILLDDESWPKVQFQNHEGYLSSKAFIGVTATATGQSTSTDVFAALAGQQPTAEISHAGVSAAVKGFAERFGRRMESDPGFISEMLNFRVSPGGYETFRSETYAGVRPEKLHRRYDLPKLPKEIPFSFSEEGSGIAIAAKLASIGLVQDKDLVMYVNYVGNLVAAASHMSDIGYKFFILDSDKVNGYACPGGIIFITRGALEIMDNEAQLACFLGHEIAHVNYRHGMQEMEERKEMLIADQTFQQMRGKMEYSKETLELTQHMEDWALDAYELVFNGRLSNYEEEADEVGVVYAARAGYNPHELLEFLKNFDRSKRFATNEHYSQAENQKRISRVTKMLQSRTWKKTKDLKILVSRFKANVN